MFKKILAVLILILAIYWSFDVLLPNKLNQGNQPSTNFSLDKALVHLKELSKQPHYLGTKEHERVRNYLIKQLQQLGLETQIQEGYSFSKWGNISKPKNIISKIKGKDSSHALLVLSHYDSNPHSSFGASDAGSGIVTILEGIRAYLTLGIQPQNDIIILFSDGEELGLNGADIFVNQHPWAKQVKLVLNFEARGSGGPSYTLLETNGGNTKLIQHFIEANPSNPVANSLAYSIYKLLPNDTDLTRFREDANIQGFNFAFIDDHFDYHSALDTYQRLDKNTLQHQANYFMPMLQHFSNANLSDIYATEDSVYINLPVLKLFHYPFSLIIPILLLAIVVFILLVLYGFKKKKLQTKAIGRGFLAFLIVLISSSLVSFFGWKILLALYPKYNEILQGFPYNGHLYIIAFTCITIAICFYGYSKFKTIRKPVNLLVAPLFFWLLLCFFVAIYLKGASFFSIPLGFGLLSFFLLLRKEKPNLVVLALLQVPMLFIIAPFVKMFPVGLGLKILVVSAVFIVLQFGLLLSVFNRFRRKKWYAYSFLFFGILYLFIAHLYSKTTKETPKPNSLVYILDTSTATAVWATYDKILDPWTKNYLTENPEEANELQDFTLASKYATKFSKSIKAPVKSIKKPKIEITFDTIIGMQRTVAICATSNRNANRWEVFSNKENVFLEFSVQGISAKKDSTTKMVFNHRNTNRLFSYYVTDNEPLDMIITFPEDQKTSFTIYEATNDLLENPLFTVPKRPENYIPKPFVLNDAVITSATLNL